MITAKASCAVIRTKQIRFFKAGGQFKLEQEYEGKIIKKGIMKSYPLEIENIGEDTYILMSKGHHDIHAFMRQVREDGYDWPLGVPEHIYLKAVPIRKDGYSILYQKVDANTRGSWPATEVVEEYGEDSYESKFAVRSLEEGPR